MAGRAGRDLTIITGGSRGIGHALVQASLQDMDVLNISRRAGVEADATAPHELHNLRADLEDVDGVESSLRAWLDGHPDYRVRILIHNAAVLNLGWLHEVSAAEFQQSLVVNVRVPLAITNNVLAWNRFSRPEARVAYIVSSLGRPEPALSFAGIGLYSITKAALGRLALIQSRELELRAPHVRILRIHPGIVDTGMQHDLRTHPDLDPAFGEKTAGLPAYEEGDWDAKSPREHPRTISPEFAADFILWATNSPKVESDEYDFYACEEFHATRSRS